MEDLEEEKLKKRKKKLIKISIMLFVVIGVLFLLICAVVVFSVVNQPVEKPIIYLYPEQETEVTIKFTDTSKLTHTYPKYTNEGWNVLASQNGDIVDLKTGRNLYSLYWESVNDKKLDMYRGFVVEGKDTISFLEEKLALLGLTEREANEFIIYWLPLMEDNKYNFVYFATTEEVNEQMPIEVAPIPDTMIRIVMRFKPLNNYIKVEEQEIITPQRNGFTLIEWGGTRYE